MNAKTIVSALIISFGAIGAAQAQTPRGDINNEPFQGNYGAVENGIGRADVIAQLGQARSAGLTGNYESNNQTFVARANSGAAHSQASAGINRPGATRDIHFGDSNNQPFQGV